MTQVAFLKLKGLHGSMRDPFWDKKKKMHTCCGSPRSYYHRSGCKACVEIS